MSKIRKISIFTFLFILIVFSSLAIHIYSPHNYHIQYKLHNVELEKQEITNATNNLILYFLHIKKLNHEIFSQKEIKHYKDVRIIFDILWIISLISFLLLIKLKPKKQEIIQNLKKIRLHILFPLILIPIFPFFWNNIFHNILFTNQYWINYPHEISYHLFPIEFFIFTLISIIITAQITIFILKYLTEKIYIQKNSK